MATEFIEADDFADEIGSIAAAAGIPPSDPRMLAFADYIVNTAKVQAEILGAELYAEMAAALSSEMSPIARQKALDMVKDEAREQAKTLAVDIEKTELKKIGEQIAKGFDEGEGPRQIARRLKMVTELDGPRANKLLEYEKYLKTTGKSPKEIERLVAKEKARLLKERRETIARTEARIATSEARKAEALVRGAKVKSWITTGDSRVSDECQANEAQGPIPIDKKFDGGVDMPPQHPICRCSVAFGTSDLQQELMKERAETRSAKTKAAKIEAKEKAAEEAKENREKRKEATKERHKKEAAVAKKAREEKKNLASAEKAAQKKIDKEKAKKARPAKKKKQTAAERDRALKARDKKRQAKDAKKIKEDFEKSLDKSAERTGKARKPADIRREIEDRLVPIPLQKGELNLNDVRAGRVKEPGSERT